MTDDVDIILLDRYRAGECTPAERVRIERWMTEDASHAATVAWLKSLEPATAELSDPWDTGALWVQLRGRLAEPALPFGKPTATRPKRVLALAAAAALALVAAGTVIWRTGAQAPRHRADVAAARTFSTGFGERAVISLADGSQVVLGAGSILRVPGDFGRATRTVQLDGRGYFEVTPDSARPFRVYTHGAVTRVLGTKFGVQAYAGDTAVAVVVREGRVAFAATDGPSARVTGGVVLERGDLGTLNARGRLTVEHNAPVDQRLAWIAGRLEFLNTPLRDVVPELTRYYGVTIVAADRQIDTLLWTASLSRQSLDDVLSLLTASLELGVERRGDRIVLHLPSTKGVAR